MGGSHLFSVQGDTGALKTLAGDVFRDETYAVYQDSEEPTPSCFSGPQRDTHIHTDRHTHLQSMEIVPALSPPPCSRHSKLSPISSFAPKDPNGSAFHVSQLSVHFKKMDQNMKTVTVCCLNRDHSSERMIRYTNRQIYSRRNACVADSCGRHAT